jgi:hypothetical protein
MANLKSEIWVSAFLRTCQIEGLYGAVIHRGAADAGAVYVCINHLDKTFDLLVPPPGPAYGEKGERRFTLQFDGPRDWEVISAAIARHRKFDSDIWVIEIEDRNGLAGIIAEKR